MTNKITQKIEITKYDKPKAKGLFVLFKALELFGVFLLTFGFYGLGCLVHKHFLKIYEAISSNTSYLTMWFVGFFTFLCLIIALGIVVLIGFGIFYLIAIWIQGNWNLAKRFAEDSDAKAKRLKQQEVNEKKEQRSKFGCCVGDEVKILGESQFVGKRHLGDKGEIGGFCSEGHLKIDFGTHCHWYEKQNVKVIKKQNVKVIKKQKLTKGEK